MSLIFISRKIFLLVFLFFWLSISSCQFINSKQKNNKKLENVLSLKKGDFLFQDLDGSPLCDAIESVTPGYNNFNFSHIGIVIDVENLNDTGSYNYVKVAEALPGNVKIVTLNEFLNRSYDKFGNPKVIVGRLRNEHRESIEEAISFIQKQIGKPYDQIFSMNDSSFYCSELIYRAFEKDNIFSLKPMTFLDSSGNEYMDAWLDYYSKLNQIIPQGELGINPGNMSLNKKIDIVHYFGEPSKSE